MINHVRTLLLNRGREGHGLNEVGEEYIPADFIPRALNRPLSLIHSTLFGNSPDRMFMNYRMRQIMQLMHATPLAVDLLDDDPRITYLPFKDDLFEKAFKLSITQLAGPEIVLHIVGEHVSNMSLGLSKQTWDVTVGNDATVTVSKRRGIPATETFDQHVPVPLIGSGLQAFLQDAPAGYKVQIESLARPGMDVSTVLSGTAAALGEYGLGDIFPMLAPEPVATWQRIWEDHPASAMKFTAMLLAIAYRTAQMPQEVRSV